MGVFGGEPVEEVAGGAVLRGELLLAQKVSEDRGEHCPERGRVRGGRAREPALDTYAKGLGVDVYMYIYTYNIFLYVYIFTYK